MTAPFTSAPMPIKPDWIDYNGHLNMAYYAVLFDSCADQAYPLMGFGPDYAAQRKLTTYTAEFHICYLPELHLGDAPTCTFQLIDYDEKRIHAYQELYHPDGWLAATAESLTLHVDMTGPRVAPMPADTLAKVAALHAAHAALPTPPRVGRSIAIPRKP